MDMNALTGGMDLAQVLLYVFWAFFALLIFYLQAESRREGYMPEDDLTGQHGTGWFFLPPKKTFTLPHGHGTVTQPNDARDNADRPVPGEKTASFPGAPYKPTSDNPMLDSIGPGSWAERSDTPDMTFENKVKIVPMRVATDYTIATGDPDPRGMRVVGYDEIIAGRVKDVWVDRAEAVARYLEVSLEVGTQKRDVLVPINFTLIKTPRDREDVFYVDAIGGEQFALVPGTKDPDQVTFLEEDKIMAYFGSGLLYANERRQESLL